jgi:hypothetical protein
MASRITRHGPVSKVLDLGAAVRELRGCRPGQRQAFVAPRLDHSHHDPHVDVTYGCVLTGSCIVRSRTLGSRTYRGLPLYQNANRGIILFSYLALTDAAITQPSWAGQAGLS